MCRDKLRKAVDLNIEGYRRCILGVIVIVVIIVIIFQYAVIHSFSRLRICLFVLHERQRMQRCNCDC